MDIKYLSLIGGSETQQKEIYCVILRRQRVQDVVRRQPFYACSARRRNGVRVIIALGNG